jgi:chaperonin cofactor prefoldin
MDDVRAYLEKLNTCSSEDCNTIQYSNADKKVIRKTGLCVMCLRKMEHTLKEDGTFPFYEDYKITNNQLSYVIDLKAQFEEAIKAVSQTLEFVNEDGTIQKWHYDVDVDKVKKDLQKDIDGASEAIEALLERKAALEDKLKELNHLELIKN